jgi:hypothetical protein
VADQFMSVQAVAALFGEANGLVERQRNSMRTGTWMHSNKLAKLS